MTVAKHNGRLTTWPAHLTRRWRCTSCNALESLHRDIVEARHACDPHQTESERYSGRVGVLEVVTS